MSTPDVTDQYAPQIVDKLLELARIENEDNAVLCMKIIMEFERNHLNSCASKVQPFLDLILELFQTMDQTVTLLESGDLIGAFATWGSAGLGSGS